MLLRLAGWSAPLAVVLACPAVAAAGTVSETTASDNGIATTSIVFTGGPGEANHLEVTEAADEVIVRDDAHTTAAGDGCTTAADGAHCPLPAASQDAPQAVLVRVEAGDGDDTVHVGAPADGGSGGVVFLVTSLAGGDGDDRLTVDTTGSDDAATGLTVAQAVLSGDAGDDELTGGAGDDELDGGAGADTLHGGAGDDELDGDGGDLGPLLFKVATTDPSDASGVAALEKLAPVPADPGSDTIDGGDGEDVLSYARRTQDLVVSLGAGAGGSGGERDSLAGIEDVVGGDGADRLSGDAKDNQLTGGNGDNVLRGGSGDDVLVGGRHGGRLDGGRGDDALVGPSAGSSCGSGTDTLVQRNSRAVVDAVRFQRNCERVDIPFAAAAIDLRSLRRSGRSLTFRVRSARPAGLTDEDASTIAAIFGVTGPSKARATLRRGHMTIGRARLKVPNYSGQKPVVRTIRVPLSRAARRSGLRGVHRVRLTLTESGVKDPDSLRVDLPLG